jgi:hypothetical protein
LPTVGDRWEIILEKKERARERGKGFDETGETAAAIIDKIYADQSSVVAAGTELAVGTDEEKTAIKKFHEQKVQRRTETLGFEYTVKEEGKDERKIEYAVR